ncbi:hypothetical protein [Psychrobacter sp. BF1]|uniref:hypothetical protein n=1 Tax=Psychrobacter sp. BF1 TaxID=2821147 RepID=UPI001C4E153B
MHYTAIIKDGGLFIPNVFSDLNDGHSRIVEVVVDIEEVRQQLSLNQDPIKSAPRQAKKPVKKSGKKELQKPAAVDTLRKNNIDELESFDDGELSEMLKAYMNNEQVPEQISLENL